MTNRKILDEVVNSHQIKCRGVIGIDEPTPALPLAAETDVVVAVHKSGISTVNCQYRTGGLCNAGGVGSSKKGNCPLTTYESKYVSPTK